MSITEHPSDTQTNNGGTGVSTALTCPKPTNLSVGDLVVCVYGNDHHNPQESGVFTPEASNNLNQIINYSANDADCAIGVAWKKATASEPANYQINAAAAHNWWMATFRFSGQDASLPIGNITARIVTAFGTGTSRTIGDAGADTTRDDSLAVAVLAHDGGDGSPFTVGGTGWTERVDITTKLADGGQSSGVIATKAVASAGAPGDCEVTVTSDDGSIAAMFIIQPAASGSGSFLTTTEQALFDNTPTAKRYVNQSTAGGRSGLEPATYNGLNHSVISMTWDNHKIGAYLRGVGDVLVVDMNGTDIRGENNNGGTDGQIFGMGLRLEDTGDIYLRDINIDGENALAGQANLDCILFNGQNTTGYGSAIDIFYRNGTLENAAETLFDCKIGPGGNCYISNVTFQGEFEEALKMWRAGTIWLHECTFDFTNASSQNLMYFFNADATLRIWDCEFILHSSMGGGTITDPTEQTGLFRFSNGSDISQVVIEESEPSEFTSNSFFTDAIPGSGTPPTDGGGDPIDPVVPISQDELNALTLAMRAESRASVSSLRGYLDAFYRGEIEDAGGDADTMIQTALDTISDNINTKVDDKHDRLKFEAESI